MSENEPDFAKLQKLLALKRHEQPPPGYFNKFSSGIVARIKADRAAGQQSAWREWLGQFRARPALAALSGAAVMTVMVLGLSLALQSPPPGQTGTPTVNQTRAIPANDASVNPLAKVPVTDTNGAVKPPPGLFEPQINSGQGVMPAGFEPKR